MARQPTDILTYVLITAISALIWYGAAGKTQSTAKDTITVRFVLPDASAAARIEPENIEVELDIEGSAGALRDARDDLTYIQIELPAEPGARTIDLIREIERSPELGRTAVSLVDCEPREANVEIVEMVREQVPVVWTYAGITTQDQVEIDPPEVTITMPRPVREQLPGTLEVSPQLDNRELSALEPGLRHTLENVRVALLRGASTDEIEIDPPHVSVSLTVRSRISEFVLERPVRVQLLASPEDRGTVTIAPVQLREVTVRAPIAVIDDIKRGEARVVAVLTLLSTERVALIKQKRISHFIVERNDGRSQSIEAWVGAARDPRPMVDLAIELPDDQAE